MNKLLKNNAVHPQTVEVPEPLVVHPSVSSLAAELLMKTVEVLLRTPEKYLQCCATSYCGSPCCIVGHMEMIHGTHGCCLPGGSHIGLTDVQWIAIFSIACWPCQFQDGPTTAAIGIARIEHFLRTGE